MRPCLRVAIAFGLVVCAAIGSSSGSAAEGIVTRSTNWTRVGGQAGAKFGSAVAPAGDVNGDGFSDVLIGAPGWDNGPADAGAARLYLGSALGLAPTAAWTFLGTQAGAGVGSAVGPAGDLNHDGYGDFVVGAALYDGPSGVDQGRVYVFLGAPAGPSTTPSQTLDGPAAGAQFGFSVATAGDIDADSFADLIIGAPRYQGSFAAEGQVVLWRGTAGGLVASGWSKNGGATSALLGASVSSAGDFDADGFDDVIVGAPGKGFMPAAGQADVYRGSAGGLGASPFSSFFAFSDSAQLGASVALAGDVEGDGYADVLVAEPNYGEFFQPRYGRVTIYRGSSGGQESWYFRPVGQDARENYGGSVASAGDLNGDGYADVVIGADRSPQPSERRGRIEIYLGGPNGLVMDSQRVGDDIGQAMGFSVGTAGDVNGDGFSDLVIGEPGATGTLAGEGRVTFYRGGAWPPTPVNGWWPKDGVEAGGGFGFGIAGGIDMYGSSFNESFVSSPFADIAVTDNGSVRGVAESYPDPFYSGALIAAGPLAGAKLGSRMARGWDVNGDRYEDLLTASPDYTNGEALEGSAQVYYGGPNGIGPTHGWSVESNLVSEFFGEDIAGGDFNGDGYGDVLVSSLSNMHPEVNGGAVAFYGSPTGPPLTPSWTAPAVTGGSWFGFSIGTGDWDADGFTDAAFGAPNASNGQAGEGRVFVFFGGPGGLALTPGWILESDRAGANFGRCVDTAGDVNGDGVADIVVGAPSYAGQGAVFVAFGDRGRGTPSLPYSRTLFPDVSTIGFGDEVSGIGDIDKDGYGDIAVGAPNHSNGQVNEGRVAIHRGSPSGFEAAPLWAMESDQAEAWFGKTIARLGDMNMDGWPDFAIGSPYAAPNGKVWMMQGGGRPLYRRVGQVQGNASLTMGGTLQSPNNPSNLLLLATMRSPAGRTRPRIEMQVAPTSQVWAGATSSKFGPFDTGAPGSLGSAVSFAFGNSPLPNASAYRWRTRNLPDSPYFPPGPWAQPRGFDWGDHHFKASGVTVDAGAPPAAPAARARLSAIAPSPFREDGATIRYRAPHAGAGTLDVFDARGRHVRRLVAGPVDAGDHEARFDGRDGDGHVVPAGVYFVRLSLDGERDTRKLVRLP